MHRKHTYQQRLEQLLEIIDEGQVPADLSSALTSLRAKIQAEKDHYLSLFQLDNDVHRQPSMGVIELLEEFSSEPTYYFGADVAVRSSVRLKVFQAHVDRTTNSIVKDHMMGEVTMSAKQFGDVVSSPNRGTGHPVTLVAIDRECQIPEYDPAKDPTKESLQRLSDTKHRADGNAKSRMKTLRSLLNGYKEKGRISKREANELVNAANTLSSQMAGNAAFQINRLSEEFQNRSNEVSLNTHLDMNALAQSHFKRLGKENDRD